MQPSHVEIKALIENNSTSAITHHCRVFLAAKWVLGSEQLLKTYPDIIISVSIGIQTAPAQRSAFIIKKW